MPRSDETHNSRVPDERALASEDPGPRGHAPQLVCVPPAQAAVIWPHVRELIRAAMRRGGLSSFRPVEANVLAGDALLWLAWDGAHIQAAAVTELHATEWRKACVIVACGGPSGRSRPSIAREEHQGVDARLRGLCRQPPLRRAMGMTAWLPLLAGIETYARAAGCACVRIMGRKGWARALPTYRTTRIVLEKEL
jgi:hypothetical protein